MKQDCPSEAEEQKALFQWANLMRNRLPGIELMFHIPNGGSRDIREAANLKAQGVKPGIPDLFIPVPVDHYHGCWIEMKRVRDGRISDKQKDVMAALIERGYFCAVCYGWWDAAKTICAYYGVTMDEIHGQQMRMEGIR